MNYTGRRKDFYRNLWIQHNGPIPREPNGRSFEIHHMDSNRDNNDISDLQCLSIQDHYEAHRIKGEWGACIRIAAKMNVSPEILSELASLNNLKRVANGTNPFSGPKINMKKFEDGTHPFLRSGFQKEMSDRSNTQRVAAGNHNFQKRADGSSFTKDLVLSGAHTTQQSWTCEHCNRSGKGEANYFRWHHNNCKQVKYEI